MGVIKNSDSPWSSPIVPVGKPDGDLRLCVDYRRLNDVTVDDAYPLPRIDEMLAKLAGSKFFSCLDMVAGYHQIEVAPADRPKTAFIVETGIYEYIRMPFGLKTAPATYQRMMASCLAEFVNRGCLLVYLDDIIIHSATESQHLKDLEEVLQTIEREKLKLKPSKCQIFASEVKFLGHRVDRNGVSPLPAKLDSVRNWAPPTNATELQSFLGFCNFYRWFVPGFAEASDLLYKATKADPFHWDPELEVKFQALKLLMISSSVLALPDPKKEFFLQTDASQTGIGAVLMQTHNDHLQPIEFFSRTLSQTERRYATYERELLAVYRACEHFKVYLLFKLIHLCLQ